MTADSPVTFLFTDIEGSTKLWEHYDTAMREALQRHDALMRQAVEKHGGKVFKMVGDAVYAAFREAPGAVAAACEAQRILLAETWPEIGALRVRMALHTGPAQARDADFFGPVLNRVARLLAVGHGGQMLLSEAARKAAAEALPAGCELRDLGSHRLKDLQRPEQIFQLRHPELPADFPPLRSLQAFANNLPSQTSTFVGREPEILAIKDLLASSRLLTLTGAGGSGKSRLSLQVGAEVLEQFRDGVWLIELAPLTDPALVPQTAAATLGLREEPGRPMAETLCDYLASKALLLMFDNCEHLVGAVAHLMEAVMHAAPRVNILATSREPLQIAGETTFPVPSLGIPDPQNLAGKDAGERTELISNFEAVRLFVERAAALVPGFAIRENNAWRIAQICHRLDGIPLAIELAAARIKVLSVEQIALRLDDRFRLLTGGSRTALPRQQTLRAAIDWSYDLLTENERTLFTRLSVFADGWSLVAAESICASADLPAAEVFELTAQLVNKSLVIFAPNADGDRYRMLETMRQYGQQRLRESGDETQVASNHAHYFLAVAERAGAELTRPDQVEWHERLEAEHDNLRAALEWFLGDAAHAISALRMVEALKLFWWLRGYFAEGQQAVERALAVSAGAPAVWRARVLNVGGVLAWFQADYARLQSLCGQARDLALEISDREVLAASLILLGSGASFERKMEQASSWLEQGRELARETGDPWLRAQSLHHSAIHALHLGDLEKAAGFAENALVVSRAAGDKWTIAIATRVLGFTALQRNDYAAAMQYFEDALALYKQLRYKWGIATCMAGLAKIATLQGKEIEAAHLYGAAEYVREMTGAPLPSHERADHDHEMEMIRASLGDEIFLRAFEDGRAQMREELSGGI